MIKNDKGSQKATLSFVYTVRWTIPKKQGKKVKHVSRFTKLGGVTIETVTIFLELLGVTLELAGATLELGGIKVFHATTIIKLGGVTLELAGVTIELAGKKVKLAAVDLNVNRPNRIDH